MQKYVPGSRRGSPSTSRPGRPRQSSFRSRRALPSGRADALKLYRRLLGYVRPYRAIFALATVGMLVVASTDVMMLRIVQPMLNSFGTAGSVEANAAIYLPLAIVGVFVLRGIGSYISENGLAWSGSRVVFDLRCNAAAHTLRLSTSFYDACCARTPRSRRPSQ